MQGLVTALKHIALFLLGTVMALTGFYFAWMLAIVYFKMSGRLVEGPMFHEMTTPEYGEVAVWLGICAIIIGACLLVRRSVLHSLPPKTPPD